MHDRLHINDRIRLQCFEFLHCILILIHKPVQCSTSHLIDTDLKIHLFILLCLQGFL